jgi:hypothetical protein
MLDKGKRSIEVDYSDEYVTFQDLMQTSSECVRTIAPDHGKTGLVEYLGVPYMRIILRRSLMDESSQALSGISLIFLLFSRLRGAGGSSPPSSFPSAAAWV